MTKTSKLQHLELHGTVWRVRKRVPEKAVPILGKTRLTQSLGTSDLNEANRLKHQHLLRMNAEIAEALGKEADTRTADYLAAVRFGIKLNESRQKDEWERRTGRATRHSTAIPYPSLDVQQRWFGE